MKFCEFLVKADACPAGRDWVGRHGMKWMWENCEYPGWMMWLLWKAADTHGWLSMVEWGEIARYIRSYFPPLPDGWYLNAEKFPQIDACNYIRGHVKLGKLAKLTARYEED